MPTYSSTLSSMSLLGKRGGGGRGGKVNPGQDLVAQLLYTSFLLSPTSAIN